MIISANERNKKMNMKTTMMIAALAAIKARVSPVVGAYLNKIHSNNRN